MIYYLVTFKVARTDEAKEHLLNRRAIVSATSLQEAISLMKRLQTREEFEDFIFYSIKYMRISLEKAYNLNMSGTPTYSDLIHGK